MIKLHTLWLSCLLLIGCASVMKNETTTTYPDGRTVTSKTFVRPPANPLGGSTMVLSNGFVNAGVSGSQDKANINRANWVGRNNMLLYGGCALLILLGGLVMAFGSKLGITPKEANRDGIVCISLGFCGFAALRWVESSEKVMAYVLPALIIGAVVFFAYRKLSKPTIKGYKRSTT